MEVQYLFSHTFVDIHAVLYVGFPAPGDKVSLDAPHPPVSGSINAKNELGVNGVVSLFGLRSCL